jgi:hypothetical protein
MPVHVGREDGKYRVLEPDGSIAVTVKGFASDGGGYETKNLADLHALLINVVWGKAVADKPVKPKFRERAGPTGGYDSSTRETPDGVQYTPITRAKNRQTLYVKRELLNADEIIDWAIDQGFSTVVAADDMHVTVIYSKAEVDWTKADIKSNSITIRGGKRHMEQFDEGAVVLAFASSKIEADHERFMEIGASFDYDHFQPHVTISYKGGVDIADIEPYRGPLIFGPEIREPVKLKWADSIKEEAV